MELDLMGNSFNHGEQSGDMVDCTMFIQILIHIVDRDQSGKFLEQKMVFIGKLPVKTIDGFKI